MQVRIPVQRCGSQRRLAASDCAGPIFQSAEQRFYKRAADTPRCGGILVPGAFACCAESRNLAFLTEGCAVAGVQLAFGQHTIRNDHGMVLRFDVIIVVRGDAGVIKNGTSVYKHTYRHKLVFKK